MTKPIYRYMCGYCGKLTESKTGLKIHNNWKHPNDGIYPRIIKRVSDWDNSYGVLEI